MAETPSLCSFGTVVSKALLSASPESPKVASTVTPAAASLTSLTASWTPASSGGPRKARLPVWGRTVPILRVRSSAGAAESRRLGSAAATGAAGEDEGACAGDGEAADHRPHARTGGSASGEDAHVAPCCE